MRTDFLGLEAFLYAAELGSFGRAAEFLNLSQPAISHRIRKLEDSLNVQLFVRPGKELFLTDAGADLLPRTRELLTGMERHLLQIKRQNDEKVEKLTLGCLPILAMGLLPKVIGRFSEVHPDVPVRIFDLSPRAIEEGLRNDTIEFGITNMAASKQEMATEELFEESYALVLPLEHTLSNKKHVTWANLQKVPLIRIGPDSGYHRLMFDQALGDEAAKINWTHEVLHVNTALAMVIAGAGATIAPIHSARLLFEDRVRILPLRRPTISRRIGLVTRRGMPRSPFARRFIEILNSCVSGGN